MSDTFYALHILALAFLVISHYPHQADAAGVMCYNCDQLPHQRDCDRVVECGTYEECYGEQIVTDDGLVKFRSGCKSRTACDNGGSIQAAIGKRNDIIPCSKCCNSSYCNLETCDKPVTSNRKRCLSCEYALTPTDCNLSIQCNEDEECYAQTIIHNQEKRYRLGCVHKTQCGTSVSVSSTVGRRATDDYCGQCCDGSNCNRDLCSGKNVAKSALMTPPPLRFCRDNSTSSCATKSSLCNDDYYKYYQCPATCRQCGTAPVVTVAPVNQNTPAATTEPVTTPLPTLAANECRDNPTYKCSPLVCIAPDVAKECRVTCNTCKVTTTHKPATTTHKPVTTTQKPGRHSDLTTRGRLFSQSFPKRKPPVKVITTTPDSCQTVDAIPECQCKYLDQEASLCHESTIFKDLRKFCCYYCNRKHNRSCDRCAKIEENEKQQVANMDIGCIDPSLQG